VSHVTDMHLKFPLTYNHFSPPFNNGYEFAEQAGQFVLQNFPAFGFG
jgi:hypothetical protein